MLGRFGMASIGMHVGWIGFDWSGHGRVVVSSGSVGFASIGLCAGWIGLDCIGPRLHRVSRFKQIA